MSKPREFAHLIRNKFGSADNINHLGRNGDSTPMTSAPEDYSLTAPSASTSAGTPAAASASTTAASTSAPPPSSSMAAGNSNSLPGHGSQVYIIITYENITFPILLLVWSQDIDR